MCAVDVGGKSRFSGIIAFEPIKEFIIDPTISYETSDTEQDRIIRK